MSDGSKAESLAAARKMLRDYKKNQEKLSHLKAKEESTISNRSSPNSIKRSAESLADTQTSSDSRENENSRNGFSPSFPHSNAVIQDIFPGNVENSCEPFVATDGLQSIGVAEAPQMPNPHRAEPAYQGSFYPSVSSIPPNTNSPTITSEYFDSIIGAGGNSNSYSDPLPQEQSPIPTATYLFSEYVPPETWNLTPDVPFSNSVQGSNQMTSSFDTDLQDRGEICPQIYPEMSTNFENHMVSSELPGSESTEQISSQTTVLFQEPFRGTELSPSTAFGSLEEQNQELLSQLAAERRNCQQLKFKLIECSSKVVQYEARVTQLQKEQEMNLARHVRPLEEQLRAHAQTVGILVGEKTELESALAHHISTSKQHASEVEELQTRLQASRFKASELEKELALLKANVNASDTQKQNHIQELDRLRLENSMLNKQMEEAVEETAELREKLNTRVSEVAALEIQLQEKQSQLSLAQLRVTQLSSSDNAEASVELESMHHQRLALERRCTELNETVRQLTAERVQADQQYQQYVAQLNDQLQSLNEKIDSSNIENERLKSREEELVRNMSELEKQFQQQMQQAQQHAQHQHQSQLSRNPEDNQEMKDAIAQLTADNQTLSNTIELQTEQLANLQLENQEREARISELEAACNERPDQSKLLAAMESDKVAAAQATSQNAILKQQLQELQDGFIKMSNDKLALTESLEHEKHVNRELGEKIAMLAEELHELRMHLNEKKRELQEAQEHQSHPENYSSDNHYHSYDHGHSHDHGPTHGHGHAILDQSDDSHCDRHLHDPKEQIESLANQNSNLRRLLAQKSTESQESGSSSITEGATTDDAAVDNYTNCEDSRNNNSSYLTKQLAMEKLQERFTRTMAEVAELTEEKQRLEHVVMQLQGETETIGEYVALYQTQRAALQQRARDKDHQLACLSAEREELRRKLAELNDLVHRLVEEKNLNVSFKNSSLPSLTVNGENKDSSSGHSNMPDSEAVEQATQNENSEPSTAGQILALLTEIGSSSLVDARISGAETFHPCPWCSGKLITV